MALGRLGFGCMRLPQLSDDATDIDFGQVERMFDAFLEAGFTYFDTSYVYHGGASEHAVRRCLVDRHPRESFTVASKMPIFSLQNEEQAEEIFAEQLAKVGVEHFDYYLLHNIQLWSYEDVVERFHLFDHMRAWKEAGKIDRIGFSFHDSPELLERILSDHPEVEFVQIVVNYYDWEEPVIAAHACYDVARAHGCEVVAMESVKGGALARLPEAAHVRLHAADPVASDASWALRFAASHDGMLAVLSGMSDLAQTLDNVATMRDFEPLGADELVLLEQVKRDFQDTWEFQAPDWDAVDAAFADGYPASRLIRLYNSCNVQPNPYFAAELNYPKNLMQAHGFSREIIPARSDGGYAGPLDVDAAVQRASSWLQAHAF